MNAKPGTLASEVLAEAATSGRIDVLLREFGGILPQIRASRERTRAVMRDNKARLRRPERRRRAK